MKYLLDKSVLPMALNCSAALATDGIAWTSGLACTRLEGRNLAGGGPVGAVLDEELHHRFGFGLALVIHACRDGHDVRVELHSLLAIGGQRVDEGRLGLCGNVRVVTHEPIGPGAFPHERKFVVLVEVACPHLPGRPAGPRSTCTSGHASTALRQSPQGCRAWRSCRRR